MRRYAIKIRSRFLTGVFITALVTLLLAGVIVIGTTGFARRFERIEHSAAQHQRLEELRSAFLRHRILSLKYAAPLRDKRALRNSEALLTGLLAQWQAQIAAEIEFVEPDEKSEEEEERELYEGVVALFMELKKTLPSASEAGDFDHRAADHRTEAIIALLDQQITDERQEMGEVRRDAARFGARLRRISYITGLGLVLAIGLLFIFFRRRVVIPLERLAKTADRIGRGDFSYTNPFPPGDEVAELSERMEQMAAALKRNLMKELLFKELNHRVKNNLALVSSLISLKERNLGSGADLSDIRNQVDAIGLVHRELSEAAEQRDAIKLSSYLPRLLESVFTPAAASRFTLDLQITPLTLDAKRTVTLGLIVNEIATNTLKYGIPPEGAPEFRLLLEPAAEEAGFLMTVSNNGPPLPAEKLRDHTTLGMQLITSLTEQLGGTLSITGSPHPRFAFRIPLEA